MKEHLADINYDAVRNYEAKTRHDVMATFSPTAIAACGKAHYPPRRNERVRGDNTDLVQMKEAAIICEAACGRDFGAQKFALGNKGLARSDTRIFKPAQLTTVGKRASLWMYELVMDYTALEQFCMSLPFLGVKGTTGTQASYMSLFDGDAAKVKKL